MKTAIITGASVGIGAAAAARFRDRGFSVYNLSRRQCPVEGVENICCDLSDRAAIDAAIDVLVPAVEQSSEVALVHNACRLRLRGQSMHKRQAICQGEATNPTPSSKSTVTA